MYKKFSATLLAASLLWSPFSASAHVTNSDTMYTDIGQSDDKHAILYASALRLISNDASLFKPNDMLTREDFAAWYAHFQQWDTKDSVAQAVKEKIITQKSGHITYKEVNDALFGGEIDVETSKTMTRGEYADFVASHADDKLSGGTLIKQLGYEAGPAGEIEAVAQKNEQYTLTIDGENYTLAEHPNVDSDSTDPRVWEGQVVTTSLLTKQTVSDRKGDGSVSDEAKLQYVAIGDVEEVAKEETTEKVETENTTENISVPAVKAQADEPKAQSAAYVWWMGGGIALILLAILRIRTKKRGQ